MANSYNTNVPTYQANTPAALNRILETAADIPSTAWSSGGNFPAPNSPGLGITSPLANLPGFDNRTAAGTPTDTNWTLLDPLGDTREPQKAGNIGFTGFVDRDPSEPEFVPWYSSGGNSTIEANFNDANAIGVAINPDNLATGAVDVTAVPLAGKTMWLQTLAAGWIEDPTP